MTLYAFDGASPFDLAAAKANGAVVITGYVIGRPGGMAPIDKARVDQVLSMGMRFLPNAELAADFFQTCTLAEAQQMGAEASAANRALGLPADNTVACPASFDFDFTDYEAKYQKLLAYGRGLNGYLPRAYGPYGFLEYITQPGRMPGTKHWLMMSTFGRPYNPASPGVCMVQEHTLSGAWLNSPVAATDISTITDLEAVHAYGGTDMPLNASDLAQIRAIVNDEVATILLDRNHEYLPTLHERVADVKTSMQPTVDRVTRISAGLDTGTPVPFASQGELTLALRKVAAAPQAPSAEQIADVVIPRVPAAQANVDVAAFVDAVVAKLPPQATKEEIAQAFRDNLVTNPIKLS